MAIALVAVLPMGMTAGHIDMAGNDTTEAEYCSGCHFPPGNYVMPEVVDDWYESQHYMSYAPFLANTYCASCHSPFQADPAADDENNDPVSRDDWQGVTCGACHPSHDDRVAWGTPIGNYDIETGEHFPVYDANELCDYCHKGDRHEKEFQGYGTIMDKKDVECIDCHLPQVPDGTPRGGHLSHTFEVYPEFSCGLDNDDCHPNHSLDWAEKQIQKGIHEKGSYGQVKEKGK
jgi:hypothetical protein